MTAVFNSSARREGTFHFPKALQAIPFPYFLGTHWWRFFMSHITILSCSYDTELLFHSWQWCSASINSITLLSMNISIACHVGQRPHWSRQIVEVQEVESGLKKVSLGSKSACQNLSSSSPLIKTPYFLPLLVVLALTHLMHH